MAWITSLTVLAATSGVVSAQQRQVLPLNEGWRAQKVDTPEGAPSGQWQTVDLPHTFATGQYQSAWYEKDLDAPPLPPGWRARLHFGGIKYNSRVWLNGQEIGGHFGGYDAFELDATAALRPGQRNVLRVGCHDWTGIFSPGDKVDIPADWHAARSAPKDRLLAPIGGRYGDFGLWDRVELRYVPPVRVAHASIRAIVKEHRLEVLVEVANDTEAAVEAAVNGEVLDAEGKGVLWLDAKAVRVAPGKTASVELSSAADLHLWSPDDPYLHALSVALAATAMAADTYRERFGWRQLWCEGPQFYFNGVPVILRSSSNWPVGLRTREEIADYWRQIKAPNVFCFRTHTQPWPELFYEVADEVGLLMIPEGAVWNDDCSYRLNDPEFWNNYRVHVESMISTLGNHASVVMWSLENELYGSCLNEKSDFATQQLADLVRFAQKLAPTQPVMLESDGDPLGSVDVIGIHYPWELPNVYAYPDAAYWMDKPIRRTHWYEPGDGQEWTWKRDKPIYLGEYLWCPDNTPSLGTVFFGDEAYASPQRYHQMSKAEAWRLQTQAYRYYRASGLSPWTMVEGGPLDFERNPLYAAQRDAMAPLAAFPLELNTRFFAGGRVTRHVRVFNDSFADAELAFVWTFGVTGQGNATGRVPVRLAPCQFKELEYAVEVPAATERTDASLTLSLVRGQDVVYEQKLNCTVWPREPLATAPKGAVLFDPNGATAKLLGAGWQRIDNLAAVPPEADLLVAGDGAFAASESPTPVIGDEKSEATALAGFLDRGGTVLVLAQTTYPAGLFPTNLTDRNPTMCFATMADHPALAGLTSADLRWWAGDGEHGVAVREPSRPVGGRALAVSGSKDGLQTAPLLEYPAGAGTILLSQLRLVEKADREPAARRLLGNLIRYAADHPQQQKRLRVLSAPDNVRTVLERTRVLQAEGAAEPSQEVLFASGDLPADALAAARQALDKSGTLYLHRPTAATAGQFLPKSLGLSFAPAAGPVSRVGKSRLAEHVLREDLYWLDLSFSYSPLPAASDMIDTALVPATDRSKAQVIPAGQLKPVGQIVEFRGDHIICATIGEAEATVDFGKGGPLLIGGSLGGSPAGGRYPVAEVRIDGQAYGTMALSDGEFRDYAIAVEAPAGEHRVSLAFVNDANIDGQDRNMLIRDLTIQPAPLVEGVDLLTSPAAVVSFPSGNGRVLIDCLRWDDSPHAGSRGLRALAGLLTGLGATFSVSSGSIVEGESMTIVPEREWNRLQGSELYLGTSGGAEVKVRVAKAGRYLVDVVGWGTPVDNEYPILGVLVGGEPRGTVELRSDSFQPHRVGEMDLPEGEAMLRLEFTNDKQVVPADRNAHIDRVEFRESR
jgi:hypothetical protein